MTDTYAKSIVSDEATDADSPITESLMQSLARTSNYTADMLDNKGANTSAPGFYYESDWESIATISSRDYTHGLGRTPTIIFFWTSTSSDGWVSGVAYVGNIQGEVQNIQQVDGTKIRILNSAGGTRYVKVICW